MKRPKADCKARFLALLRAQAHARTKDNAPGRVKAEAEDRDALAHSNGNVNDIITLRVRLAALIACRDTCRRPVRLRFLVSISLLLCMPMLWHTGWLLVQHASNEHMPASDAHGRILNPNCGIRPWPCAI